MVWKDGALTEAKIKSLLGVPLQLRLGNQTVAIKTKPGDVLIFDSKLHLSNDGKF